MKKPVIGLAVAVLVGMSTTAARADYRDPVLQWKLYQITQIAQTEISQVYNEAKRRVARGESATAVMRWANARSAEIRQRAVAETHRVIRAHRNGGMAAPANPTTPASMPAPTTAPVYRSVYYPGYGWYLVRVR